MEGSTKPISTNWIFQIFILSKTFLRDVTDWVGRELSSGDLSRHISSLSRWLEHIIVWLPDVYEQQGWKRLNAKLEVLTNHFIDDNLKILDINSRINETVKQNVTEPYIINKEVKAVVASTYFTELVSVVVKKCLERSSQNV